MPACRHHPEAPVSGRPRSSASSGDASRYPAAAASGGASSDNAWTRPSVWRALVRSEVAAAVHHALACALEAAGGRTPRHRSHHRGRGRPRDSADCGRVGLGPLARAAGLSPPARACRGEA
eukprot:scaffold6551_cov51-Phaeocystis_antarctica.AAC.2